MKEDERTVDNRKDLIARNLEKYKFYAPRFKRMFGVPLFPYWSHVTGFDVVRFDQKFVIPGFEQSTADALRDSYGEEAVQLVIDLIGREKDGDAKETA